MTRCLNSSGLQRQTQFVLDLKENPGNYVNITISCTTAQIPYWDCPAAAIVRDPMSKQYLVLAKGRKPRVPSSFGKA